LYEDKTLRKYTLHIITAIAFSLPIPAIVALYYVIAMNARLGPMALFTVVFADACRSSHKLQRVGSLSLLQRGFFFGGLQLDYN
jgi:hypothetical protein